MSLQICRTIEELRSARRGLVGIVGLVPTMGALHEGHRSLVRAAKASCDAVVVSIFVNPTQFGPNEDFSKYPRSFEADCAMLAQEGVDLVFAPQAEEMYPAGAATYVDVGEIGTRLDGASRPGHFRGVATVVMKLFHIVMPEVAFFGQKDAAQVAVLKAMVRDLNVPVRVEVCPTMRETDGLAMSSRNVYLSARERQDALSLSRALGAVRAEVVNGVCSASRLREILLNTIGETPAVNVDYAEVVDPETLLPVADANAGALVAVAAWVGKTRLIDNVVIAAGECGASR